MQSIQRNDRPIPTHLQQAIGEEIEKLKKKKKIGHIEEATDIHENSFLSPPIVTVKRTKR